MYKRATALARKFDPTPLMAVQLQFFPFPYTPISPSDETYVLEYHLSGGGGGTRKRQLRRAPYRTNSNGSHTAS